MGRLEDTLRNATDTRPDKAKAQANRDKLWHEKRELQAKRNEIIAAKDQAVSKLDSEIYKKESHYHAEQHKMQFNAQDLIDWLSKLPPDTPIYISQYNWDGEPQKHGLTIENVFYFDDEYRHDEAWIYINKDEHY